MPRKSAKPRPFYTVPEAAARLGIHRWTAWNLAKTQGHLYGVPAIPKTKTTVVFSRAAIDRIVSEERMA